MGNDDIIDLEEFRSRAESSSCKSLEKLTRYVLLNTAKRRLDEGMDKEKILAFLKDEGITPENLDSFLVESDEDQGFEEFIYDHLSRLHKVIVDIQKMQKGFALAVSGMQDYLTELHHKTRAGEDMGSPPMFMYDIEQGEKDES